ncbi:MAG TPA: hypothetical protein VKK61_00690, partial [Tepidisphaeraceae bacterium]|nr:hypothetical protein [Tepidisphaeraceae bacterium]
QNGYKARYIFHVSGANTGVGGAADLTVKIAGDADESFFDFDPGSFSADWATIDHQINGQNPQTIHVQFSDQFVANTQDFADGSNVSGASNFGDTLTLAQIVIVDANGDPVSGVTISSASGTVYPVPEPAAFAIALPAILCLIRRHTKN